MDKIPYRIQLLTAARTGQSDEAIAIFHEMDRESSYEECAEIAHAIREVAPPEEIMWLGTLALQVDLELDKDRSTVPSDFAMALLNQELVNTISKILTPVPQRL